MIVKLIQANPLVPSSVAELYLQPESNLDGKTLQKIVDDFDILGYGKNLKGEFMHVRIPLDHLEKGEYTTHVSFKGTYKPKWACIEIPDEKKE